MSPITPPSSSRTSAPDVLAHVEELITQARYREAIDELQAAIRHGRSPELEARLVALRHLAFGATPRPAAPAFHPPQPTSTEGPGALMEVEAADLSLTTLRSGLSQSGCLLVRNLIATERAAELAAGVDRALLAFDEAEAAGTDAATGDLAGWFTQFEPSAGDYRVGGRRKWVRASGAVWTADSPRMLFELLELVDTTGIGELVTAYLGEPPALSANKCTLRRVPLTTNVGWHQDGAFLGEEVRTINMWLSLAHCGRTAPGLDLVPRRIDHVVESGTEGAMFDWSVAPDVVSREAANVGVLRPEFGPGDALLFDHLLLHSTAVEPTMTNERHAIETWFFAPSTYPKGQIPLLY
ncbi:MAG: hypothetical protein ABIP03_11475 [Aquihabitans sp.]